jgi:cytochrome c-type biogenesis protein CcmE
MKKSHIALLFFIAFGFVALAAMLGNSAKLGNFETARSSDDRSVRISGTLVAEKGVEYDPHADANSWSFWMEDDQGEVAKVVCFDDKPYDFEKSDEVVLTGKMKDDVFFATDLLVKCPSKYNDAEIAASSL